MLLCCAVQTFQDSAPPCLTLTHYVDLAGSKALVLMSGEMDTKMLVGETLGKPFGQTLNEPITLSIYVVVATADNRFPV